MTDVDLVRIDRVIAALDARIGAQLDAILHHPDFQALEAAWRGLGWVVDRVAFEDNIRLAVWSITKSELSQDFAEIPDITQTRFFRTIYTSEYGQFGGQPYAAILATWTTSASKNDVTLLQKMASVAAMAHAPIFVGADPTLLGLTSFDDLPYASSLETNFDTPAFSAWNALRESEDSRYVGVLLPRILLRLPYREAAISAEQFVYDETTSRRGSYLWGSPTFAFAVRLASSFAQYRTYVALIGAFDAACVLDAHPALGRAYTKPPVEVVLSRPIEQKLSELGFLPLTCDATGQALSFSSASSLQLPKTFGPTEGDAAATLNFLLGTRFPYLLLACRFAHYLKVLERERIGAKRTPESIERELNEWLAQYVVTVDSASAATRLKYPLRAARVRTYPVPGEVGWFRMEILLQPHIKYLRQAVTLSVAGRIDAQ
ncbi:MAG: type VI secretion system contractile sheath large subunit [Polyangiaceae bacterium]|nr:type VI secretion system contractile sheath large subunit [Polyangiaceae bacterium]